jgi:hypothetical protein
MFSGITKIHKEKYHVFSLIFGIWGGHESKRGTFRNVKAEKGK